MDQVQRKIRFDNYRLSDPSSSFIHKFKKQKKGKGTFYYRNIISQDKTIYYFNYEVYL